MALTITQPRLVVRDARPYLSIHAAPPMVDLGTVLPTLFEEIWAYFGSHSLANEGPPFVRYNVVGDMHGPIDLEVGIPVASAQPGDDRVQPGTIPAGTYAVTMHTGPYDRLMQATAELLAWAEQNAVTWATAGDVWQGRFEFYLTDPQQQPDPQTWEVEIAFLTA
jgi:effector-binding domain-containing protein